VTLALAVAVAGGTGAVVRYLLDGAVQDRTSGVFPYGTLTVNVVGSFVLGVLTGLALHNHVSSHAKSVLGAGFCGGLTTWSTASWETVRLLEEGETAIAMRFALGGLGVSLAAAGLGLLLTAA